MDENTIEELINSLKMLMSAEKHISLPETGRQINIEAKNKSNFF